MITISMSVGMICCLVSLAFVGIIMWLLYKNRSKCINHPIVIGMSAISLIIAVTTVIYLCCKGGCCSISNINYGDTSVTVLTVIVGLLIGWNIYSVIDTKSEVAKLKEERSRLQEYVKANRNYAIGITNLTNQKYGTAIGFLCSAAVKANKILDKEMLNDCLGMIKDTIDEQKDHMDDISYLDSFMRLIRDDLRGIKDERIDFISKSIEEIISSQEKKTQKQNKQ